MAASAYAALVSLMNVLIRVQHPSCPATFDRSKIEALLDSVSFVVGFLETHSQFISKDLQRKITGAADEAQDRIESFVVVRIHESRAGKAVDLNLYYVTMDRLDQDIRRMDIIIQEAKEVEQLKNGVKHQQARSSLNGGSSHPPSGTLQFVGFEDEVNRLLEKLATNKSSREIISVVGMGGIGKSTLAVSVYNVPYIRHAFDVRGWVTISQVYDIGTVIHSLLHEFGVRDIDGDRSGERLHKYLFGRKYLIILDDIWDVKSWEGISRFLPDNRNGSRVILTTRNLDVARNVGSGDFHEMQLLDDEKSWDLLSKMVFGLEVSCPLELEECGRRITKGCKGLPLAIVVIGGMLKMHEGTLQYWAYVGENVSSIISREDDEHCLNILSWSYHELPIHLKPCFLYMASFPEDYEICVSELTMLWAADGFLKPKVDNTPEEVALEYLDNLVKRSIVIVKKRNARGNMKRLILHDLVRDLCIREAQAERFLSVDDGPEAIGSLRRLAVHEGNYHHVRSRATSFKFAPVTKFGEKMKLWTKGAITKISETACAKRTNLFDEVSRSPDCVQSLLCFRKGLEIPNPSCSSLLRVFFSSHRAITVDMLLANLRFVKLLTYGQIPRLISLIPVMWNLETVILEVWIGSKMSLPPEIWKLLHVKHLIISGEVYFPDPPDSCSDSVLSNLQTLKRVKIFSNKVLHRIPNLKDLQIEYDNILEELPGGFSNFAECHKLENLCVYGRITFTSHEMLPNNLKKLTLSCCYSPWERITIVGSLPHLQVLKLYWGAFSGKEWSSTEGGFQSLKVLSIRNCLLVTWRVENSSHFPCLEYLSIDGMYHLEDVPQVFGESSTLKSIRLTDCKASAAMSAKEILDAQEDYGNVDITVEAERIFCEDEGQYTELKSFASDRFRVDCYSYD